MIDTFWNETPRAVGSPFQKIVWSKDELDKFINDSNGQTICFTSHNSYPKVERAFGTPLTTNVSKIFIDLDDEKKPENALLDCRYLVKWAQKEGLPFASAFSGGKGFHFYILLEPQIYNINTGLGEYFRNIQQWVTTKLKLRTADKRIFGDSKRLCRMWYTQYAKTEKKTRKIIMGDTKCVPLTPGQILHWSINDIIEYSIEPEKIQEEFQPAYSEKTELKLHEFAKTFDIKIETVSQRQYVREEEQSKYVKPSNDYIKNLFPRKCMHNELLKDNPNHDARFAAVVHLKSLGFTPGKIYKLFLSLNWIDIGNTETMRYQVNHIYNRVPEYKLPTCYWIKKKGFCVGKECEKYWEE